MKRNFNLARRSTAATLMAVFAAVSARVQATPHITYTQMALPSNVVTAGLAVDAAGNVYGTTYQSSSMLYKETLANGAYTQTPISTAAVVPVAVAVDSAGNFYVADASSGTILKETLANGGYTESTVVSGLNMPYGLAIDGGGNLYVSTTGDGHLYKETLSNGTYSQSLIATSALSSARAIAIDSAGNLYIADGGNNRVLKETFQSGTYSETVIVSGLNDPQGIAVDSTGAIYVDDTNNSRLLLETPNAGGYVQTVSNAEPQGTATTGLAFDGSRNLYYVLTSNLGGGVVKAMPNELAETSATTFVNAAVASTPTSQTVTFTFDVGGALGSTPFSVSTQGSTTLDFRAGNQSATACTTGTSYATGATCTVAVSFSPTRPGIRYGAVVLYSVSGSPIATGYLQGSGTSPQVSFGGLFGEIGGGAGSQLPVDAVAADGIGNIVFVGHEGGKVENVANQAAVSLGVSRSYGLSFDGAGNIFNADGVATVSNNNVYYPTVLVQDIIFNPYYTNSATVGGAYATGPFTIGSGISTGGVVVDGAGNVYFTDPMSNALFVATFSGGGYDVTSIGSGLKSAGGVAIDAAGSVYVADTGNNRILKETLENGTYTQSAVLTGLTAPSSVAVNGLGALYIPQANSIVVATLSNGSYTVNSQSPIGGIGSIAVDPSGNLFASACDQGCLTEFDLADPPVLDFATTAVGSTSSDSPQTVTVVNNGNAPLTFAAPGTTAAITAGFILGSNSTCPVLPGSSQSLTLAVGASCTVSVSFLPVTSGYTHGTLTLTDNALNAPGSAQVIQLNGTATGSSGGSPTPQVTLTPSSNNYGTVAIGTAAPATFTLANTGTIAVNIVSTALPSGAFVLTSTTCGASLAVGASCNYVVSFAPSATGAQTATFSVTDDAGTQSAALSGNGGAPAAPQASLTPVNADFGSIAVGSSSAAQTFMLSNAGGAALAVSAVTVGGTNAAEFAVASNDCGDTLAAQASCAITVTFSPIAAGAATATLSVADNAASATQSASLTGYSPAPDFTLTTTPPTQTASAGGSVSYAVDVASVGGSFDQAVALTVGNLPPGATVSFSPATVTPGSKGASAVMTIQTAVIAAINRSPSAVLPFGAPMFAVLLVTPFGKRRRALARLSSTVAIAIILAALPGCGGGFAVPQTATVGKTYTLTITGSAGSLQHTASVQLTLQ